MYCIPLPKAAKPVWARLSCLVVYANFQFVYTTTRKIGDQLWLDSASSNVVYLRGPEAFNGCLGVINVICPGLIN